MPQKEDNVELAIYYRTPDACFGSHRIILKNLGQTPGIFRMIAKIVNVSQNMHQEF